MSKKSQRREKARLRGLDGSIDNEEGPNEAESQVPKSKSNGIKGIYENHYKKLLIIPFVILMLALCQLGYQYSTTGSFVEKGVSLKGGITVTLPEIMDDPISLQEYLLSRFSQYDVEVRALTQTGSQVGLIVNADIEDNDHIDSFLEEIRNKLSITKDDYTTSVTGASLGSSFYKETVIAVIIAFFFMAIVVFLYFRILIPSAAVVLAAFSDIIITLAVASLVGIKLSTAGIAAFLMLIGYSVDTDILLSTKVLKRKSGTSVIEAVYSALGTGILMNFTTMAAVIVGMIFSQSEILQQIMTILFIGLLADIINTWIQNAGIIRWYLEKKQ